VSDHDVAEHDELTEAELEEQEPEALPDREAMSLVTPLPPIDGMDTLIPVEGPAPGDTF
jgi:hypothetical protein